MDRIDSPSKTGRLPESFRPLFWSYDFDSIDLNRHIRMIIIGTLNYGDLKHWKWLINHYGREIVREVLKGVRLNEIRSQSGRLAEVIFDLKLLNNAPRCVNTRR